MSDFNRDLANLELKRRYEEMSRQTIGLIDICQYGELLCRWIKDCREGKFNEDN